MYSTHSLLRIAYDRIDRFHDEARLHAVSKSASTRGEKTNARTHLEAISKPIGSSSRARVAHAFRRIAAWIEPKAPHPQGAPHASE